MLRSIGFVHHLNQLLFLLVKMFLAREQKKQQTLHQSLKNYVPLPLHRLGVVKLRGKIPKASGTGQLQETGCFVFDARRNETNTKTACAWFSCLDI